MARIVYREGVHVMYNFSPQPAMLRPPALAGAHLNKGQATDPAGFGHDFNLTL